MLLGVKYEFQELRNLQCIYLTLFFRIITEFFILYYSTYYVHINVLIEIAL